MSWSERRTGGERRVACRNKEKEEVKIAAGTDRLKIENQKGKDVMKTQRERERQAVLREPVLFSFWGSGSCSITPNFKGSSLKLCLETGAPLPPSVLLPHPPLLRCLAQPLKTGRDAGERAERWQRDTKRKISRAVSSKSVGKLQISSAPSRNLHSFVEPWAQSLMASRSSSSRIEGLSQREMKSCLQAWVRNQNRSRGGCRSVWILSWQVVSCCTETAPKETSQLWTWKIYEQTTRCLLKKAASVPVSPALLFMLFLAVALFFTIIHR